MAAAIGKRVGDVFLTRAEIFLTRAEIRGLMAGLLCADSQPAGRTALTAWAKGHADTLGTRYASALARCRDRRSAYEEL